MPDPANFLNACPIIDFDDGDVARTAMQLKADSTTETARRCFEFVRDQIQHSGDFERNPVTCQASDVLKHSTGYCYAKSHLLCALLRANQIPAGLCYQRLTVSGTQPPFCLHGLAAAYVEPFGWYRMDPRGNRDDINAQFCPPKEQLAFATQVEGERNCPEIHVSPLPDVVACLTKHATWDAVLENLPDQE